MSTKIHSGKYVTDKYALYTADYIECKYTEQMCVDAFCRDDFSTSAMFRHESIHTGHTGGDSH